MSRVRSWLRRWLGIEALASSFLAALNEQALVAQHSCHISELMTEVARLKLAQYVPPRQPEPERKVIATRTMKQYLDIVDQEFAQKED
jgi:hypothetical protein